MASEDEDEFSDAEDEPRMRDAGRGDEDFDEFEDSMANYSGGDGGKSATQVSNQPFDEAVELSESEDNMSNASPDPRGGGAGGAGRGGNDRGGRSAQEAVTNQPFDEAHDLTSEGSVDDDQSDAEDRAQSMNLEDGEHEIPGLAAAQAKAQMGSSQGMAQAAASETRSARQAAPNLDSMPAREEREPNVSGEIKGLFQYITRYKPHNIELETKMRPFIPDYIPAVGDIDPFIKVPRPDGKADNLGLVTLDEPASIQSDPTVLTLQLRAVSKSSGAQPMLVRSVEHAEKDPKAITGWIESIANLHRHKPAPSVRYTKPMPDIEALMQIWPAPIEELLETAALPDADINLDLASYVRTVCAMLDIPVYGSLTESLHVLFTLYSDFKANVHFQQQLATEQQTMGGMDGDNGMGGDGMGSYSPGGGQAETLSLS